MQADASDGFILVPHITPGGLDPFVDQVVPLLQERGVFRTDYTGTTLRDHLGLAPLPAPRRNADADMRPAWRPDGHDDTSGSARPRSDFVGFDRAPRRCATASIWRSRPKALATRVIGSPNTISIPGVAGTSPAVVLALTAAQTSTIRLGSGAVQMGHRTALSTVEEFGLLDALHPGRFDLGLGRSGGKPREPVPAAPRGAGIWSTAAHRTGCGYRRSSISGRC